MRQLSLHHYHIARHSILRLAIRSKLGRIPTKAEYMADMGVLTAASDKIYQYLNFDKVQDYTDAAASVKDSVSV